METKRDIRKQMLCARDRSDRQRVGDITVTGSQSRLSPILYLCRRKKSGVMYLWGKEVCTEQILVSAWRAGKKNRSA